MKPVDNLQRPDDPLCEMTKADLQLKLEQVIQIILRVVLEELSRCSPVVKATRPRHETPHHLHR